MSTQRLKDMNIRLSTGRIVPRSVYFTEEKGRILLWRVWYRVMKSDDPCTYQYLQGAPLTEHELQEEVGNSQAGGIFCIAASVPMTVFGENNAADDSSTKEQSLPPAPPLGPFDIYHARDLQAMVFPNPAHWLTHPDCHFQHVATVAAPLMDLFWLTNHTEGSWMQQPEVHWFDPTIPLRSTSIGDVFAFPPTGRAWMVTPGGVEEIFAEQDHPGR